MFHLIYRTVILFLVLIDNDVVRVDKLALPVLAVDHGLHSRNPEK